MRIEDHALIGDTQTAALVGPNDSIDWLCLPRFDSGACFASLLGDRQHGCWGETDGHILDAIVRNRRLLNLYVGLHGDPESPSNQVTQATARRLRVQRTQ